MRISLDQLGWNDFFQLQLDGLSLPSSSIIARVSGENRTNYRVITEEGEMIAEVPGKFLYAAGSESELPKSGDWVIVTPMDERRVMIHHILDRAGRLSRRSSGRSHAEQIIAANIDVLFIVQSLDNNFNIARMERYLSSISGDVLPVILLNKADVCSDVDTKVEEIARRLPTIQVVVVSALNDEIGPLKALVGPGRTFAFVGSSGVGKSTLINKLASSEILKTSEVREADSKGRHTTTRREMIIIETGGILIDTPGMREFQPWINDQENSIAFGDILSLAVNCKYSDCQHLNESGCAVRVAVASGAIDAAHYQNYLRMKREMEYLEAKADIHASQKRKQQDKQIHKAVRKMYRRKKGG